MLRDKQNLWRKLNLLGDLILTYAALAAAIMLFNIDLSGNATGLLYVSTLLIWILSFYVPSASYFYRLKSYGQIFKELFMALGRSFITFIAVLYITDINIAISTVAVFFALNIILLALFRFVLASFLCNYRRRGKSNRNVIIIGTGKKAKDMADKIHENIHFGMHIIGFMDYHRTGLWSYNEIPLIGHPDGLAGIINNNQVDYIIIASENGDLPLTRHAFTIGEEMGVTVCLLSDFYFHPISKASSTSFLDFPAVIYSSTPAVCTQLTLKNCMDALGGFVGVILSIPFALFTAIAIKLEDGGPIFFKQTRSGKNGKPFTLYKFRTMVADAEKLKDKLQSQNEMSGPVFKIKNDPRITNVGAILRKTSIDELPQFLNIMKGEMSLVGPRPPLPSEVIKYDRWQRRKLSVKPGITCLWQVNGRSNIDFEDWMKLDLEYIDNWSLWLDTKILVKTIPAVFKGSGAS